MHGRGRHHITHKNRILGLVAMIIVMVSKRTEMLVKFCRNTILSLAFYMPFLFVWYLQSKTLLEYHMGSGYSLLRRTEA